MVNITYTKDERYNIKNYIIQINLIANPGLLSILVLSKNY
jgi:hypothetical protein